MNPNTPETPNEGATPTPESTPTAEPQVQPTPEASVEQPSTAAPAESDTPFNPFGEQSATSSDAPTDPAPAMQSDPAQPAAPQPTPPGKGFNKKLLFILIGVAGAVGLLIAAAAIIFTMFFTVSKQDYREAAIQYTKVDSANDTMYYDVQSLSRSLSSSPDTVSDDIATVRTGLETLSAENKTLSEMKAVRIGEGAELYKTFNTQLQAYIANAQQIVDSMEILAPALSTCASVSDADTNQERTDIISDCAKEMDGLETLPQADMEAFVKKLAATYKELASIMDELSGITNPYGSQYDEYSALRDRLYDAQDAIREASSGLREALNKKDEEVSVKDSANALSEFLNEQQR